MEKKVVQRSGMVHLLPANDSDLMSFSSPAESSVRMLKPDKDPFGSPLSAIKGEELLISSSPTCAPLASSTPFLVSPAPKFEFPTNATLKDEDPFELVERKAQQDGDPWELMEAEAAKFTISEDDSVSMTTSNSQHLNRCFIESSAASKMSNTDESDNDKTIRALVSPPVKVEVDKDSEADDLLNEIPPWEALDDDSDLEEDLCNMVRRLSDQFMLDFVANPAEPLSDEAVRNLSLQSPRMLLSPFDCQQNLSLMSPPVGLHLSGFLSSPDFVRENEKTPEIDTRKQPGVPETKILTPAEQVATGAIKKTITPTGAIKKTVTPRVPTKPLCLITNSPAVSKLPTRLASRLLQPRNYHKGKENE